MILLTNYQIFMSTFNYVTNDGYFLPVMTASFIIAMFCGAVVHDGDLKGAKKTIFTMASYAAMLILTNSARITTALSDSKDILDNHNYNMAYAANMTTILMTVFWIFGLLFGICAVKYARRRKLWLNLF